MSTVISKVSHKLDRFSTLHVNSANQNISKRLGEPSKNLENVEKFF